MRLFRELRVWFMEKLLVFVEPYREERASLDLEWRLYAQKMNLAGARPSYWYPGMDMKLDPWYKLTMQDFEEVELDYLVDQARKQYERRTAKQKKFISEQKVGFTKAKDATTIDEELHKAKDRLG